MFFFFYPLPPFFTHPPPIEKRFGLLFLSLRDFERAPARVVGEGCPLPFSTPSFFSFVGYNLFSVTPLKKQSSPNLIHSTSDTQ
jgi:hypothetical protein